MTTIIKNSNIHINKHIDDKYDIIIHKHFLYPNFINSIVNILTKHLVIINDINKNDKRIITIKLNNVQTLTNLLKEKDKQLSYLHLEYLFKHIGTQFKALVKDNIGIHTINLKDIIILNSEKTKYNSFFIYINTDNFHTLNNNNIQINNIIDNKNLFISPELNQIKKLPSCIHYNTILYSLASLISYTHKPFNNNNNDLNFYIKHLENIAETKLYWALLRCLNNDYNNRYHLYI